MYNEKCGKTTPSHLLTLSLAELKTEPPELWKLLAKWCPLSLILLITKYIRYQWQVGGYNRSWLVTSLSESIRTHPIMPFTMHKAQTPRLFSPLVFSSVHPLIEPNSHCSLTWQTHSLCPLQLKICNQENPPDHTSPFQMVSLESFLRLLFAVAESWLSSASSAALLLNVFKIVVK